MATNPPRQTSMRRKLIGRRLRMRRLETGLPMRHAGITAIVGSTRSLQRLENGEATGLTYPIIGALCDLYKVPAEEKFELQRLWELREAMTWTQPRGRSVFGYDAYQELELHASAIFQYETVFVPGQLQTEATMRMLYSRNPDLSEADIEREVEKRKRGQEPFWRENTGRRFHFFLGEAVLRSGCDAAQIERLIEADELDHATVKYLPFSSGPLSPLTVSFTLLSFPEEHDPEIVYVEAPDAHLYFEQAESVRYYRAGLASLEDQVRSIKEIKV
jgi:transcriptional regulator with XRE-family HTH domain